MQQHTTRQESTLLLDIMPCCLAATIFTLTCVSGVCDTPAAAFVGVLQVPRGSTVALPHLSFLEVSSLPLLFMVNSMAVQRAVARSVHLAM
jgi:hypothetical protein